MCTRILYLLFLLSTRCHGYKILGVFFSAAPSAHILGTNLMRGIADAGHEATLISPFDDEYIPKNGSYRVLKLEGLMEEMTAAFTSIFKENSQGKQKDKSHGAFDIHGMSPFVALYMMSNMGHVMTEATLKNKVMQQLIHSGEKFDAVIIPLFNNDAMKGLATHFGAHLVAFSNVGLNAWVNHPSGNPSLPSYAPEIFPAMPIKMNFWQRIYNAIFSLVQYLFRVFLIHPKQKELMEKYIPIKEDFYDINYNASLFLINSHVSIAHSLPTVSNLAFIGGYHLRPPKKLPDDLQKFLDDAPEGVIYFSMGSNIKSKDLPEEKRDALLNAFRKLKQKVLWKWEDEILPGQPDNVKLSKWLPQNDILAHPNIKVFITHGGYGSTLETLYHGVPVVAIPIAADQQANALNAEEMEYGIVMPFNQITEEVVSKTLDEILNNKKYTNNAKLRSELFRSRPRTPMEEAVYWLEYIIKFNGAPHLRVVSLDLVWYQYYMFDILAFFVLMTYGSYYVVFKMRRR